MSALIQLYGRGLDMSITGDRGITRMEAGFVAASLVMSKPARTE